MVKRNSNTNGDSLDLLLDTLTNSFGAFLLVALLIALLVTDTSQSEAAPTVEQLQVLKNLEFEIESTLQQSANLQKRIDFIYAEVKKLPETISEEEVHLLKGQLAEIIELQEAQAEALNQIIELNDAIIQLTDKIADKKELTKREHKLQERIDKIIQEQTEKIRDIKQELESSQSLLISLKQQLAKKQADAGKQNRQVLFPRVSSTNAQQFTLVLKASRLYTFEQENLVRSNTGFIQIENNRYRLKKGVNVSNEEDIAAGLNARLAGASVNSHYITIFVWDDSFSSWNAIRAELTRRGYKYELTPMDNTQVIVLGNFQGRVQ